MFLSFIIALELTIEKQMKDREERKQQKTNGQKRKREPDAPVKTESGPV